MVNEQRAMTENAIARVAIITGAAGGLGSSVARLLASSGHDLALVDIKGDELSKLASEVAGLGVRCHSVAADLAQDAECRKVIEQTLSTLGKVDILVNAAALLGRTPLEDVTDMAFSKIFRLVPVGMAAVMPTIVLSFWQSLTIVWPNTSCQFGGAPGLAIGPAPVVMS